MELHSRRFLQASWAVIVYSIPPRVSLYQSVHLHILGSSGRSHPLGWDGKKLWKQYYLSLWIRHQWEILRCLYLNLKNFPANCVIPIPQRLSGLPSQLSNLMQPSGVPWFLTSEDHTTGIYSTVFLKLRNLKLSLCAFSHFTDSLVRVSKMVPSSLLVLQWESEPTDILWNS